MTDGSSTTVNTSPLVAVISQPTKAYLIVMDSTPDSNKTFSMNQVDGLVMSSVLYVMQVMLATTAEVMLRSNRPVVL